VSGSFVSLCGGEVGGRVLLSCLHQGLRFGNCFAAVFQRFWTAPGSQLTILRRDFALHERLAHGEQPLIYGDGEQSRDFTYISNVVEANLRAAEAVAPWAAVINIANGERVTINSVLETMKKLTGRTGVQAEYAPSRTGDVRDSLADLTLARSLLGYEPKVGLEEGLRLTIDWWETSRFGKGTLINEESR